MDAEGEFEAIRRGRKGQRYAAGFADIAAFEVGWESHARRHTCLLCWNRGQSPVVHRDDNGTCCLVRTRTRKFLATCAHVWRGYQSFCSKQSEASLWLALPASDLPTAPAFPLRLAGVRLLAADERLDLATLTFDAMESLEDS